MTKVMPDRQPKPTGRGFSVAELVVVLVIIATIAGVAIPRYQGSLTRYRAELAARRIVTDMAAARIKARTGSASRVVSFDTILDEYGIDLGGTGEPVELSIGPYHVDIVSADFGGDADVTFNGYGIPDSGGTVVLRSGNLQKTVVLDADTFEATIQ